MVIKEAARILFVDLKAEYESLRTEVNQAIQRVLESGNFILGQEVASFEKEFSSYLGTEYAVGVHYPVCVHETPAFENLGYANGDFPVSELASRHILSLPMYQNLTFEEVERVCCKIEQFFK